jgi:putative spermidine/putrescine transport system substrate-binding protein
VLLALSLCLLATACAASTAPQSSGSRPDTAGTEMPGETSSRPGLGDWAAIRAAAAGQTVRWWLYGGDERVNRYIDEHVVPTASHAGVRLERVPIADTADAVQRVVAEVQAGEPAGSVDLVWINGENFAAGKRAGLWLEDWAGRLPNARYVDPATADTDFGVDVDGQESPWSRALFVYAYDMARMPQPPRTLDGLLAYAREHPGRVTYPAPPDFTGSAFVRQVVQALGEDEGFAYLRQLEPLLWREGEAHPGSEAELNRLFGDGQIDLAMSYDPSFVETAVRQGTFPDTARPFVLDHGTLHNTSYVKVPANAGSPEGALVVANLLLDPELQARKADPDILGVPTVLDPGRLAADDRRRLQRRSDGLYLLSDVGRLVDELPVERVESLEQRWREEVLP